MRTVSIDGAMFGAYAPPLAPPAAAPTGTLAIATIRGAVLYT